MKNYNVSGISDWVECCCESFEIFTNKPFNSVQDAVAAARAAYSDNLQVVVVEVVGTVEAIPPFVLSCSYYSEGHEHWQIIGSYPTITQASKDGIEKVKADSGYIDYRVERTFHEL